MKKGESPQLVLEGALLKQNAFPNIPHQDNVIIDNLTYWRLTGTQKGGEVKAIINKKNKLNPDELIEKAMYGLQKLIECFENKETPYTSCPKSKKLTYNDYEHLERLPEWMNSDEEDT